MTNTFVTILLLIIFILSGCSTIQSNPTSVSEFEAFEPFYSQFKQRKSFKLDRTVFPIKVTLYNGGESPPDVKPVSAHIWTKADVVSGKKKLYVQEDIVEAAGYAHVIIQRSPKLVEVKVGPEYSEAAVGYVFKNKKGKWYLVEYFNYWGH